MALHYRTSAIVLARRARQYKPGDKVKVLRGRLADKILVIKEATADYVVFEDWPRRDVMSKGNVEPEEGFTKEEMEEAERESRRGR